MNFSKSSFHYIVKARKGSETSGASNISTANTAALGLVSCHSERREESSLNFSASPQNDKKVSPTVETAANLQSKSHK